MLKKKKGMALITVIMVMLVLAILGTTLLSISLGETKLSVNNEKKMQAYYIARSGADAVVTWIEDNGGEASAIIPASGEYTSDEVSFGQGVFSVRLSRDTTDPTVIKVESNSRLNYGNINGKAILTVQESAGATGEQAYTEVMYGKTIYFNGDAGIYDSDIAAEAIEFKHEKNLNGNNAISNVKRTYPPPNFPNLIYKGSSFKISTDGKYYIPQKSSIVFETIKDQVLKVVVDDLNIENLTINGKGSVFLFVKGDFNISGQANISGKNKDRIIGDPNSLFIFLKSKGGFKYTGNFDMSGYIYAPDSDFEFGGNTEIHGAIIAKNITSKGTFDAYYVEPYADKVDDVSAFLGTSYKRLNWSSN